MASSSTTGFFQAPPVIPSQYEDDIALRRIISIYLPSPMPKAIDEDLARFSRLVLSKEVLEYVADAERSLPFLQPLTAFGVENKSNPLVTSEGWRMLKNIAIREGLVSLAFEAHTQWNPRIYQFVKCHLWMGSSAMTTCPLGMSDGAAALLKAHIRGEDVTSQIFVQVRDRLICREPKEAWTSGQWMTERPGGSDVRNTETLARKVVSSQIEIPDEFDAAGMPLGNWHIDGFKWFSSATDADMTILLAKTQGQDRVSAFYAPLRRIVSGNEHEAESETELNGVRIQRLKNKLGTRPVPTAELELKGMRAYLIGKEGEGTKVISTLLNITRAHNLFMAVGAWGRGLAVSRAFARVRTSSKKLLTDHPAFVRMLAREHVKYRAEMHLAFLTVALIGASESQGQLATEASGSLMLPENHKDVDLILRLLTPVAKAQTALASIAGLRFCMESLGGVGFLENNEDPLLNLARLFRDTCVTAIWEGTGEIMADDLVRIIKGRSGADTLEALDRWISKAIAPCRQGSLAREAEHLHAAWRTWLQIVQTQDKETLIYQGRDSLETLEIVVAGCCLLLDVAWDKDEVATEIARRWIWGDKTHRYSRAESMEWDKRIVFGVSQPAAHL